MAVTIVAGGLVVATLDLVYEIERRGLFAFLVPSIFTPLHDTRMERKQGVTETRSQVETVSLPCFETEQALANRAGPDATRGVLSEGTDIRISFKIAQPANGEFAVPQANGTARCSDPEAALAILVQSQDR